MFTALSVVTSVSTLCGRSAVSNRLQKLISYSKIAAKQNT